MTYVLLDTSLSDLLKGITGIGDYIVKVFKLVETALDFVIQFFSNLPEFFSMISDSILEIGYYDTIVFGATTFSSFILSLASVVVILRILGRD